MTLSERDLRIGLEEDGASEAEIERALDAYEAANPDDGIESESGNLFPNIIDKLIVALAWALDQIEDDLDLDHRATMAAARAILEEARAAS